MKLKLFDCLGVFYKDHRVVEFIRGPEAARDIWVDMLDNNVSPKRGVMASLNIDRDLKDG